MLFLKDAHLFEAVHKFCESEHSIENIELWKAIDKDFEAQQDAEKRRQALQLIFITFLAPNAESPVNVNQSMVSAIAAKVQKSEAVGESFLVELKKEVVFLIADTFKRFKAAKTFAQAFHNSSLSFKLRPPHVQLTLDYHFNIVH